MKRPPDSASIVHPAIAAAAGARAGTCMIDAPSLIDSVWGASHASTLTASEPYDSAAHTESNPARSAACTYSTASSPWGPIPQYPRPRPSFSDIAANPTGLDMNAVVLVYQWTP